MKKLGIYYFLLFLVGISLAQAVTYQSVQVQNTTDGTGNWADSSNNEGYGGVFQANSSYTISALEMYIGHIGSPTDQINYVLYACDTQSNQTCLPTGAPLAQTNGHDLGNTTLTSTGGIRLDFWVPYTLTGGTFYAIVLNRTTNSGVNYGRWAWNTAYSSIRSVRNTAGTWSSGGVDRLVDYQTYLTPGGAPAVPSANLTLLLINNYTGERIYNFTAIINGTLYNSNVTAGNITTQIKANTTTNINISVVAFDYHDKFFTNVNISNGVVTLNTAPYFYIFNTSLQNYTTYNGQNWVYNMSYNFYYTCPDVSSASLIPFINNDTDITLWQSLTCDNTTRQAVRQYYKHSVSGNYSLNLELNVSYFPAINNVNFSNSTFLSDITPPVINFLNFTYTEGFNSQNTNVSMNCTDNFLPQVNINKSFNSVVLQYQNITSGSLSVNQTGLSTGVNTAYGVCRDLFSVTTGSLSQTLYFKTLILWDELYNRDFIVSNLTSAVIYYDDNSTSVNLKALGKARINFTSTAQQKLRVELSSYPGVYTDVTRYIDVTLTDDQDILICANNASVTHYEQLAYSNTETPVIIKSIFGNCYVALDYTRFAYQEAKILRAYTISGGYSLTTISDGQTLQLASIDGVTASQISMDNLIFNAQQVDISLLQDYLNFNPISNTTTQVYYKNYKNNNVALNLSFVNMDTGQQLYSTTSFSNPNEATLIWDTSGFSSISNETLIRVTATGTTSDGEFNIKSAYLNINGRSGLIPSAMALVVSIMLILFGLTLTTTKSTFSFFGIFILLVTFGVLGVAIPAWYITIMQAVTAIMLLFVAIIFYNNNYGSVA